MDETPLKERANALNANERVRLMRDGLVNNSASVVSAIVGIVLVPIMLKGLGIESYSLWIAALALLGIPAGFDLGLGATVVREVAARGRESSEELSAFVQAAGNAYLIYGVLGGCVIAALGLPLSNGLHLSPVVRPAAPIVFALCGVSFLAEQQIAFASATLGGLRRFDAVNLIAAAVVLLRAVGIVGLLIAGKSLVALMAWYALAGVAVSVMAFAVVERLDSRLRLRIARLRWRPLRAHVSFALGSQLIRILIQAIWETGPLLVGLVLGSVWIVPFYIGVKFPYTTVGATWRVAEVLFPAASHDERTQNTARTRETLELGTRWIAAMGVPVCIVFWTLGPGLLRAWVGDVTTDAVLVLRIMTGVLLADALGLGSLSILWGYGRARSLVAVLGTVAASTVLLSLVFLKIVGVSTVAWAMLISIAMGSVALLHMASSMCGTGIHTLVRNSFRGLYLPWLFTAAVAVGLTRLLAVNGWLGVIGGSTVIGTAYLASFYLSGTRAEERELARQVASLPLLALRAGFKIFHRSSSIGG
jgi:O-antigen/teichoic acid export membrane protein